MRATLPIVALGLALAFGGSVPTADAVTHATPAAEKAGKGTAKGKGKGKGKAKSKGLPDETDLAPATATSGSTGAPATAASALAPAPVDPATTPEFTATYTEALGHYKEGRYAEALAAYERAWTLAPIPEVSYGLGRCQHQLGKFTEAAAEYERFLAAAPLHPQAAKVRDYLLEVLSSSGGAALAARDFEPARSAYARAVELRATIFPAAKDATSGMLLGGLGWALAGLDRRDEAIATLKRSSAASLAPDFRVRVDALLADLEAGRRPALVEPPSGALTAPPSRGPALAIALGLGGGVIAAAGIATLVVLLVVQPGRPDLGWVDLSF